MRQAHPFYMYEAILKQPHTVQTVIERNEALIGEVANKLRAAKRIFLVGIGTSYHAAETSRYIARALAKSAEVYAVHAFDFANYPPVLSREDCVIGISHRGTKTYTVEALRMAQESGCLTIGITGLGDETPLYRHSALTVGTVEQESSSAHTVSFIGSVAILAAIFAQINGGPEERIFLRETLPLLLEECIRVGEAARDFAQYLSQGRRIWLAGGGPFGILAKEIALKIKETSYLQPEGMAVEEMIHGPFQCVESQDFFILIAPYGKSQQRALDLASMIEMVGANYLWVDDGTAHVSTHYRIVVPKVAEHYAALACLIPLQLLTYQIALNAGTNPDSFRDEDPRFHEISSKIIL